MRTIVYTTKKHYWDGKGLSFVMVFTRFPSISFVLHAVHEKRIKYKQYVSATFFSV